MGVHFNREFAYSIQTLDNAVAYLKKSIPVSMRILLRNLQTSSIWPEFLAKSESTSEEFCNLARAVGLYCGFPANK